MGFSIDGFGCIEQASFEVESVAGGCNIYFGDSRALLPYEQYYLGKEKILVHICFGLPEGFRPKDKLWAGVKGGRMVARGDDEGLWEMKLDDTLSIFYMDGRVR